MTRSINKTIIDKDKCIGCGRCVEVCPTEAIGMENGKAEIVKDLSLYCDHCSACCPTGAITVNDDHCKKLKFATFEVDNKCSPFGEYSTEELTNLMLSRRSTRKYFDKKVDRELLEDIIKIGTTAPSGTNSQEWTFRVIDNDDSFNNFKDGLEGFYKKLNKLASNFLLRKTLKLFGNDELDTYYKSYLPLVEQAIEDRAAGKSDSLFHGAKALILVGATKDASCPADDAFLATQNMLLGAHSMGLGTCLIGFASEAIKRDRGLKRLLNLEKGENIYSVIAIGYPDETYESVVGRKEITPTYL